MVEFALLLPMLIMILLGIVEFGWYIYNYSAIEHAARKGSEQAAKEPPLPSNVNNAADGCVAEIRRKAQENLGPITIPDPKTAIRISYPTSGETRELGAAIQVTVHYEGQFLTPLSGMFGGRNFTIDSVSRRSILDTMVLLQANERRCP